MLDIDIDLIKKTFMKNLWINDQNFKAIQINRIISLIEKKIKHIYKKKIVLKYMQFIKEKNMISQKNGLECISIK